MNVPFLSQLEGYPDENGYENCGPACLVMMLAYLGEVSPTRDLMHVAADYIKDGYYTGNWWLLNGSDYPLMRTLVAHDYGLQTEVVYSWPDVYAQLHAGRPVMLLNDNGLLQPRQYPATGGWRAPHFILLTGYDDVTDRFAVNDPLAYYFPRGPGWYTRLSVEAAAAWVGGVYALSIVSEEAKVAPEDQAIVDTVRALGGDAASVVGWINEIAALKEVLGQKDEEVDTRTAERDALQGAVAQYETRVALCEQRVKDMTAAAEAVQKPTRVEVLVGEGRRLVFVPAV